MVKRNKHLEEMASDLEEEGEEGEDEEMPDAKAWGQKKQDFFHTDYVDDDLPGMFLCQIYLKITNAVSKGIAACLT